MDLLDAEFRWTGTGQRPSAADLHEAGGKIGALPVSIKPVQDDMTVWGPAYPVRVPPADNLWLHRAVYAAPEGSVLVVRQQRPVDAGYWGEVMTEAARARGLGGLVFDGGIRDVSVLATSDFPVFAGQRCIRGTGKDPDGDGSLGEAISWDDVTVSTGDLVVGDADGVVIVSSQRASEVVAVAVDRIAAEREMIAQIRAGARTLDLLGLA